MKPIVLAILGAAAILFFFSCKEKNEDITTAVNKNGSVETEVKVEHIDSAHDVLTTTHIVWVHNNALKTVVYRDTLPSLGMENREAENEKGDTKTIRVKKDYEIFLTVK